MQVHVNGSQMCKYVCETLAPLLTRVLLRLIKKAENMGMERWLSSLGAFEGERTHISSSTISLSLEDMNICIKIVVTRSFRRSGHLCQVLFLTFCLPS